jgi:type II secretory pathway pseudopilin PulG
MRRSGLTLIETLVGMVIIGLAFYILISVFASIAPRTANVDTINKKVHLAQSRLEEYLARNFSQVTSVGATSFTGSFTNYQSSIVVTYVATGDLNAAVAGPTNFKNVKVRVWGGPVDALGTVELTTLVTSYEVMLDTNEAE